MVESSEMGESITERVLEEFNRVKGEIVNHQVWGVPANAFILRFPEARRVLSSRDGFRRVSAVCNCYLPEPLWPSLHNRPDRWKSYLKEVLSLANLPSDEVAALSTGVNMADLAWAEKDSDGLWVSAFVTAGVKTNAMRIGKDRASHIERHGQFEELGTINIILLTSASLNSAALAASFITITEAKVIALQELEVRSSYNPDWQATGTGTDQIVMVSGKGSKCTYVGGHSRIGELMARVVTTATANAIEKGLKAAD